MQSEPRRRRGSPSFSSAAFTTTKSSSQRTPGSRGPQGLASVDKSLLRMAALRAMDRATHESQAAGCLRKTLVIRASLDPCRPPTAASHAQQSSPRSSAPFVPSAIGSTTQANPASELRPQTSRFAFTTASWRYRGPASPEAKTASGDAASGAPSAAPRPPSACSPAAAARYPIPQSRPTRPAVRT